MIPPENIAALDRLVRAERAAGLSRARRDVLVCLAACPGCSYEDISAHTDLNRESLRLHVAELRKEGLLVRSNPPENIRIAKFSLSAKGQKLIARLAAALNIER